MKEQNNVFGHNDSTNVIVIKSPLFKLENPSQQSKEDDFSYEMVTNPSENEEKKIHIINN
jgi:hypothetical protein